jgi:hypothetical protein
MLVGADGPRQNTAFALEELRVIVAEKQARAAQSGKSVRIISSGLILIGPIEAQAPIAPSKCQRVAELPRQFGADAATPVDPFVRAIAEQRRIDEKSVSDDRFASAYPTR